MPTSNVTPVAPAWTIPGYLEARDGRLYVEGADSLALAREYGSPLFVFSEPRIRSNVERLKRAAREVERPVRFFYASKANSNMAVLTAVREAGIDIEVTARRAFQGAPRRLPADQIVFKRPEQDRAGDEEAITPECLHQHRLVYEIG